MNDTIEGTVYGDSIKVSQAEAESLIIDDEGFDRPNTQVNDQQTTATVENTSGEEATGMKAETQSEQLAETESASLLVNVRVSPTSYLVPASSTITSFTEPGIIF